MSVVPPCIVSAVTLPPLVGGNPRGVVRLSIRSLQYQGVDTKGVRERVVLQPIWWGENEQMGGTRVLVSEGNPIDVLFPVLSSHKYLAR